jgi:hypothetical protein
MDLVQMIAGKHLAAASNYLVTLIVSDKLA